MNFQEIKKILSEKCVGIAGCGGLGSNAAVALARVGIGRLIVADFDSIEEGNLNRQYYFYDQIGEYKVTALKKNINKINFDTIVEDQLIILTKENVEQIFRDCDVILEAFDRAEMKEMLIETLQSELPDKPIVSGVGMAGWGRNEFIKTRRFGNLFLVGDGETEADENHPPLAPRVSVVANMMANIVLELLLGKFEK